MRLFLEEALLRGGGGEGGSEEEGNVIVFEEVQNLAFKISKELNDYSVLITYWEALFFAVRFEMKQKALTILKEHPNLARYVKM